MYHQYNQIVRGMAVVLAIFIAIAATHETLLLLEMAATESHCGSSHAPSTPAPVHHQDHACALCELAGATTLPTLAADLPLPQVSLEFENLASCLTPAVRDESCFPHLRRAPPTLPIV